MNIIILDKRFEPLAPVNSLRSLIWDRRDQEPGMFELHCGSEDFEAIRGGAYVFRLDREELGIIQESNLKNDESGAQVCYAKGYFAEAILNDRVIDRPENISGKPSEIARTLVTRYFIDTSGRPGDYEGRQMPNIGFGMDRIFKEEEITKIQATGKPIGDLLHEMEADQGMTHRLRYDYETNRLLFNVQMGREIYPIFSDDYENIRSSSYHKDETDAPNVVFVAGCGEGADRKILRIDMRSDTTEHAREMYVDARDLQQYWTNDEGERQWYTDEDYLALLEARGMQKLSSHKSLEYFDIDADANANLVYLEDYDVGDWCIIRVHVFGMGQMELERQITSIRETYEGGMAKISITFGNTGPNKIADYVAKAVTVNTESFQETGVGDLQELETKDKNSVVGAINEISTSQGDLSALKTETKKSIVDAINEIIDEGTEDSRVGDMEELTTEDKTSVVGAVNETNRNIGKLSSLTTTAKGSAVDAINETKNNIGELSALTTTAKENTVAAINETKGNIGDISQLSTQDKTNLVAAINEVAAGGGGGGSNLLISRITNNQGAWTITAEESTRLIPAVTYEGMSATVVGSKNSVYINSQTIFKKTLWISSPAEMQAMTTKGAAPATIQPIGFVVTVWPTGTPEDEEQQTWPKYPSQFQFSAYLKNIGTLTRDRKTYQIYVPIMEGTIPGFVFNIDSKLIVKYAGMIKATTTTKNVTNIGYRGQRPSHPVIAYTANEDFSEMAFAGVAEYEGELAAIANGDGTFRQWLHAPQ